MPPLNDSALFIPHADTWLWIETLLLAPGVDLGEEYCFIVKFDQVTCSSCTVMCIAMETQKNVLKQCGVMSYKQNCYVHIRITRPQGHPRGVKCLKMINKVTEKVKNKVAHPKVFVISGLRNNRDTLNVQSINKQQVQKYACFSEHKNQSHGTTLHSFLPSSLTSAAPSSSRPVSHVSIWV